MSVNEGASVPADRAHEIEAIPNSGGGITHYCHVCGDMGVSLAPQLHMPRATDQGAPLMIETTTKYATTVSDLPAAWAFVMDHLDGLGPDPEVHIKPMWIMSVSEVMSEPENGPQRQFEVTVSGMVQTDG